MNALDEVQELHLHVLETAPALHPERRAKIFRGLALIIGDEAFARDLLVRAEACDALQRADRQLPLAFMRSLPPTA